MQFNYDTSGAVPLFSAVNPTAAGNLALYPTTMHREERYRLGEDRYDAQLNLTYNTAAEDRGFGAAVGGRYTAIRQDVSFTRINYTRLTYTLADASLGTTLCGFVCDTPIPVVSADKVDALFAKAKASALATVDAASSAGGTYKTREDVTAGYIQAQYRTDRLYLVGGVRVEHTASRSSSTQATNGVYAPVSASNDYTHVLPSGLIVFDTSAASKLRVGASMTVSRPNFGSSSLRGGVLNTLSNPPTLSTGNPDLKPRRAVNADIGHDWYLDGGRGIVSIAGFYKWIRDDIFTYGVLQNVSGVTGQVLITQARNTDQLVRAYGIEVSASHDLTFLPAPFDGFGVSANATFSRARFPVTLSDGSVRVLRNLPSQPGRIYNASLYYDKGRVHGRFAWNYLGELYDDRFPNFTPAGFYANRYQQPTNNFDVQASYDVTRNVTVSIDALNLSKQGMQYRYGND